MGRKHCGKRRNCLLRAISPFSTVFSKGLFSGASKGVNVWEWVKECIYSLPNDKSLDYTKLKAFADNKMKFAKMTISVFDRLQKSCGKRRNC